MVDHARQDKGVRNVVAMVVALPWIVWALLRTLGIELPFPLVALMSFTPYAALTSPLPVLVALVLRRWAVAVLAGVAALAVALGVVPRGAAGPPPGAGGARLRGGAPDAPARGAGAGAAP